jgi:hypothetical protein
LPFADAEPAAEVKTERDEAVKLAGQISSFCSQLQIFPGEEAVGARIQKRMREGDPAHGGRRPDRGLGAHHLRPLCCRHGVAKDPKYTVGSQRKPLQDRR